MKPEPVAIALRQRTRCNAAVVVNEPRIAIVESATVAEPCALDDALGLLVTWAIRACTQDPDQQRPTEPAPGRFVASAEAVTLQTIAAYGPED